MISIGLRGRLVLSFIAIIIIPILLTIGLLWINLHNVEDEIIHDEKVVEELFLTLEQNVKQYYQYIQHDKEMFYQKMRPMLQEYEIDIVISDNQNHTLFRSNEFTNNKGITFNIQDMKIPITVNNQETIHIELIPNTLRSGPFQAIYEVLLRIIISLVAGFLSLIGLIILFTWIISRTILVPLKDIYHAVDEIKEGNLDYKIRYRKKDEIGHFIRGFNLMRDHLKESLVKQQIYEQNRKELIASISHDLRTPLSSIQGYVEGLQDGVDQNEEMKQRYLHVIKSKTEQLDRLIEDLFEFSKLDLDQLSIEQELVNSTDYFSKVLNEVRFDLQKEQVQLIIHSPIPAVCIQIDPHRISQVITNIIDNSVRYGATVIEVSIKEKLDQLIIHVKDNGSGICDVDLPHIFNRFYRGEKSRSREHGGAGLGLSIAKSIMDKHDGQISVESIVGAGSVFSLSFPVYIYKNE
ncbi:sensor histidine kinase [Bacillus salitolerans]|uniref:histidine kinase n=1 Tax=Bacillus salitolerans TaxID=1437434 RepID=A0ABW4LMX8_9BACI